MTAPVAKAPLKVGLIVDSFIQPRWLRRSLEKILAGDVASLELVVKVDARKKKHGSLLYELYGRLDNKLFAGDALEPISIEDLLKSVPVSDEVNKELDVLINFGPADLNPKFAAAAKHGVWFYSFGEAPGFKEVMDQTPVTFSSLRALTGNTERIVYQSASATLSRFSVNLNNNTCYWKSAAFVARALEDLYHGCSPANSIATEGSSSRSPSNAAMSQMFLNLSGRAASRALEKFSSYEQWVLAYRIGNGEFKYLVPPSDRFWADPFPITVDGRHYIFFEDYVNAAGRAHISVVEVDQDGIVSGPTEALKLDCHLSYPFVFEWRGDYYMIPETGARNVVELYRSASFPFTWQPQQVLLEANSPLDATLAEVNGTWWMFVNIQEEGVAVNWDELHLYHAESPLGPWKPHARNPIVSDVRSARPAGHLFCSGDVLYRPSQDSSLRYGYATTINKIVALSPAEYRETEVAKILPDWDKDVIGVHTINSLDGITVIDCLTKRSRFRNRRLTPPGRSLDLLSSANMELLP